MDITSIIPSKENLAKLLEQDSNVSLSEKREELDSIEYAEGTSLCCPGARVTLSGFCARCGEHTETRLEPQSVCCKAVMYSNGACSQCGAYGLAFAKIGEDDMGPRENDEDPTLPDDDEDAGKEDEDPYHEVARENTMAAYHKFH